MVGDTKPILKTCSRCGTEDNSDKFIKKRNICKLCSNARKKEQYYAPVPAEKKCTSCDLIKPSNSFLRNRSFCKDCNNEKRRDKYKNDEDLREKLIQQATLFKQSKAEEQRKKKEEEIGKDNKKCSSCNTIKPATNFRHNRLKCKICERDEPADKFKRSIRGRIWYALKKNKKEHTIHYLGCDPNTYFDWILKYDQSYTIENRGKVWHIDHVIPLSLFNLDNPDEQLVAFNWRNTMPLSARENLAKNNRIIVSQIEQHYTHLIEYHKEKQIELPQVFIDLFARYLVAGIPLEPSLPLTTGNICEELG